MEWIENVHPLHRRRAFRRHDLSRVQKLADVLRPMRTEMCAVCGASIVPSTRLPGICPACLEEIRAAPGPFVLEGPPRIVAAREYGGSLTRALEAFKLRGHLEVGITLSRMLLSPLFEARFREGVERFGLVPVPAGVSGKRRRGFDQSFVLARELSRSVHPLITRKRGVAQKSLNRELRRQNAACQYVHARLNARDSRIPAQACLIDDVVTTGASVMRCGELLEELGIPCPEALAVAIRL